MAATPVTRKIFKESLPLLARGTTAEFRKLARQADKCKRYMDKHVDKKNDTAAEDLWDELATVVGSADDIVRAIGEIRRVQKKFLDFERAHPNRMEELLPHKKVFRKGKRVKKVAAKKTSPELDMAFKALLPKEVDNTGGGFSKGPAWPLKK